MIFNDFLNQELRDKKFTLSSNKRHYSLCYRGKEIKVFDADTPMEKINKFATRWVEYHKED